MRVLAIFDSTGMKFTLDHLAKVGNAVTVVTTPVEAFHKIRRQKFDVLLCQSTFDQVASTIFEVLKEVRSHEHQGDIPFIGCSVDRNDNRCTTNEILAKTLIQLGGQGFIEGSVVRSKDLEKAIKKCLSNAA